MNDKPVDRPSQETVEVRQGTGPRNMVSVLMISTIAALVALVAVFLYFYTAPTTPPA